MSEQEFTCNEHDLPDDLAGGVTLTVGSIGPAGLEIRVHVDGRSLAAYLGPNDAKRLSRWITSALPRIKRWFGR